MDVSCRTPRIGVGVRGGCGGGHGSGRDGGRCRVGLDVEQKENGVMAMNGDPSWVIQMKNLRNILKAAEDMAFNLRQAERLPRKVGDRIRDLRIVVGNRLERDVQHDG